MNNIHSDNDAEVKVNGLDELIVGRNAVSEAISTLKNGSAKSAFDKLYVAKSVLSQGSSGKLGAIIAVCKDNGIVVKDVAPEKLQKMCGHANHQGIALSVAAHSYAEISDIFALASERQEKPFIIVCDEIEDPHNLGAIIRSAEVLGAHGVVIPERRAVGLSGSVSKAASGALAHIPVARVKNIAVLIDKLKEDGVWVYGADFNGQEVSGVNFDGAVALVIGSEGNGIGRLVRDKCDIIVTLPMYGKINSFNASVAAGILMYEVAKQRHLK